METVIINGREWEELSRKIDRIAGFIEQYGERLPADDNTWLSEREVCNFLKISAKTLLRSRNTGDVNFSTIGKKHFYKVSDIKALLERKSIKILSLDRLKMKPSPGRKNV